MVELRNPLALFLLVLMPLVWYWYRRRRQLQRPATALWLIEKGRKEARSRRQLDLRLLALLASLLAVVLALAGPQLRISQNGQLVIVLDASASMAARDRDDNSRLEAAKEPARKLLAKTNIAVLVRAGLEPQAYGPAPGKALIRRLEKIQAGDATADLQKATSLGRNLLPGAPVLVISDAAPPQNTEGYLNVAGNGQNVGITALGPAFAAVYNAGPANWRGSLQSSREVQQLTVAPGRYTVVRFAREESERRARLSTSDVLPLDDLAFYASSPVPVDLKIPSPDLERALLAIGSRFSPRAPKAVITAATPPDKPGQVQTAYFASDYGAAVIAADVDPTDPLTRGVSLTGLTFHLPDPPPGSGWMVLARDDSGRPLIWRRDHDLYLPPPIDWKDRPALVVLLYNWLAPLRSNVLPLGSDGVLRPSRRSGKAYSLLSAAETNLPRPRPNQLLGIKQALDFSSWLAVLAAFFLLIASRLKVPAKNG